LTLETISKLFSSLRERPFIQFKDREKAGESLAYLLKRKFKRSSDIIITISIPRGGTIIGDVIARNIKSSLDIILPQRLVAPSNNELTIGAIMKDGSFYLDHNNINTLKISNEYLEKEKYKALKEINNKELVYGKQIDGSKIKSNIVILVDDGAATGSTLIVTSRWIKKFQPKFLTIAIPICPKNTLKVLKYEVQDIQSLFNPGWKNFTSISKFYKNFLPLDEKHIIDIVKKYNVY
jgi:putative phosphoribosyl transferase